MLKLFISFVVLFSVNAAYAASYFQTLKSSNGIKFVLVFDDSKVEEGPQIYEVIGKNAVKINWDQDRSSLGMSESIYVLDDERSLRLSESIFRSLPAELIIQPKSPDVALVLADVKEELFEVNNLKDSILSIFYFMQPGVLSKSQAISSNQEFYQKILKTNEQGVHDYYVHLLEGSKSIFMVSEYIGENKSLKGVVEQRVYVHEVDRKTMGPAKQRAVSNVRKIKGDMFLTLDSDITMFVPARSKFDQSAFIRTASESSNENVDVKKQRFPLQTLKEKNKYQKIVMKSLNSCKSTFQQ